MVNENREQRSFERVTVTGRIVNDDRELTAKALDQLRDLCRRGGCIILTAQQVPMPMSGFLEIDYAALERRVLARLKCE